MIIDNVNISQREYVDLVIETGEQNVVFCIYNNLQDRWKNQFDFEISSTTYRSYESILDGNVHKLQAKCNFVKVNDYILCLICPSSRFVNHSKMEEAVLEKCGLSRCRMTNVINLHI